MGWNEVKHDPIKKALHLKRIKARNRERMMIPEERERLRIMRRRKSQKTRDKAKFTDPERYARILELERRLAERRRKKSGYYEKQNAWRRKYRKINPSFKLAESFRTRIISALRGRVKSSSSFDLLVCSLEKLKTHLESLFKPGMNWENHGKHGWHIDHIRPCASFDLTNSEDQKLCFHYSNLQPLWSTENLRKSSMYQGKMHEHTS